ncbi:glycosyltransferase [Agromyces soli]
MTERDASLAPPRVRMPRGRQFAVTWSIPDEYAGMTAAMLARCDSFARLAGTPVDVLTFDARPDTPQLAERLRERGALADGVGLLNLYDWLREHPLPGGTLRLDRDAFTPLAQAEASERLRRGERVVALVRRDDEGRVLQIDHLREDGSLVLSDRRDVRERGTVGGRALVLCDGDGRPVRSWRRIWPLYTAWLDALTAKRPSFMIVDSKTIAPFMLSYRRPHVVTAHVVHASHRSGPGETHPVRATRREVFEHLDRFDLVALLSRRQAHEVAELLGPRDNVSVIPNAKPAREAPRGRRAGRAGRARPADRGVVLASLTPRKRVAHAIRAVAAVNGGGPDASAARHPVRLDVYGDGEERAVLEALAATTTGVELHGFERDARARLDSASFLLLTSQSEGFPLVLVEAMAAGCLPIAYDIRYGPADLIRDGRNGFLVRPGDVDGLASAIERLQRLSPRKAAAMRRAAVRSARAFDEERVVATWARELGRALARRELHASPKWRRTRTMLGRTPFAGMLRRAAARGRALADRARAGRTGVGGRA